MDAPERTPFGTTDGLTGPFEDEQGFVLLDRRYGPVARPASEYTRSRVIAGTQGSGKTLFLRRLHEHFKSDESVHTTATLKVRELDTETVVDFAQHFTRSTNTESWTVLWDRAIHASAASYVVLDSEYFGGVDAELRSDLATHVKRLFGTARTPRNPVEVVSQLARNIKSRKDYREQMFNDNWIELAHLVQRALSRSRELYIFIDAIDDNYRYAPTYWQQCQRGLFHAVMDTQRTDVEATKLHVIISIRDLTLSSIARSEHATRYLNDNTIVALNWSWEACDEFLRQKLENLSPEYFEGREQTLAGLLGRDRITNSVRDVQEPIEQYLLRHTRLSPRDIISTGNALVELVLSQPGAVAQITDEQIRERISTSAKRYAKSVLAQIGNQVLSNVMPWNAARHHFADFYVTTDEYTADAMVREMCSVLLTAEGEVLSDEGKVALEAEAEVRFGADCHFIDAMWQNRMIGVIERGRARFYGGALVDDVATPTATTYVLNSLLMDVLPGLPRTASGPIFPGSEVA